MAENYKVLGQVAPNAQTLTGVYLVPLLAETIVSSLLICNRTDQVTWARVAVRPAGAPIEDRHYVYYDLLIPGNDTFIATVGMTLEPSDVVSVYAEHAFLSFSLFGTEITE